MTSNHSSQEVPSQVSEDSTKLNEVNKKITSSRQLWSEEVESMEKNSIENKEEATTQSEEVHNQKVDLILGATVNLSDQNTRVVNMEKSCKQ